MLDDAHLEQLEEYLRLAPALAAREVPGEWGGGGHGNKMLVALQGGVRVMVKPGDGGQFDQMARREAAAWTVARELGWPDLVPATVYRAEMAVGERRLSSASLQVLCHGAILGLQVSEFSFLDRQRAAIFDRLVHHSDRGGANWVGMPDFDGPRPILIDNGYAFEVGRGFASAFVTDRAPQGSPMALESDHREALQRLQAGRQAGHLADLLGSEFDGLMQRTADALEASEIAHP